MQSRIKFPFALSVSMGITIVAMVDYLEIPFPLPPSSFAGMRAFWVMFLAWALLATGAVFGEICNSNNRRDDAENH